MTQRVPGPKSGTPTKPGQRGKRNGQFDHPGDFPEIGGATSANPRGGVKRNDLRVRKPGGR